MSDDRAPPILPTVADVIGPAKARLAIVRPSAAKHIEKGNYAVPFKVWRGQFTKIRARLAAEVKAAFLRSSEGDALSELAAYRYDTPRATSGPTNAVGNVRLTRRVVHYLPSAATVITADDATNLATLSALLSQIRSVFNAHGASVYASGTGLGAHHVAETLTMSTPVTATMGDIVATVNDYKNKVNLHLAKPNTVQILHNIAAPHLQSDNLNTIATAGAFASASGAAFSAQTLASQQSALALGNAIKRALNAHVALRAPAGTFKEGDRVRVEADPTAIPPITVGEYVIAQNTYARTGATSATVPVRAIATGPGANLPAFSPSRSLKVTMAGNLYDAAETLRWAPATSVFAGAALTAAGGTNGQTDALLRTAAAANWQGSYGPTDKAIVAGVYRYPGVARAAFMRDTATGTSAVYVVDESWAQSAEWQAAIEQALKQDWVGVGCRLSTAGAVVNRVVRIELSVVLRQRRDLLDTTAITAALRSAVVDYFDNRPDWWIFRLSALRAVCSRANAKILKCASATVLDATGVPIDEPPQPVAGDTLTHWWFAGGLDVVFDAST